MWPPAWPSVPGHTQGGGRPGPGEHPRPAESHLHAHLSPKRWGNLSCWPPAPSGHRHVRPNASATAAGHLGLVTASGPGGVGVLGSGPCLHGPPVPPGPEPDCRMPEVNGGRALGCGWAPSGHQEALGPEGQVGGRLLCSLTGLQPVGVGAAPAALECEGKHSRSSCLQPQGDLWECQQSWSPTPAAPHSSGGAALLERRRGAAHLACSLLVSGLCPALDLTQWILPTLP